MFFMAAGIVLIAMALILIRALRGPTAYDRILAVNQFGTVTVLAITLMSFIVDNMMYLDIALVYALINFTATIAYLRYYEYNSFSEERPRPHEYAD